MSKQTVFITGSTGLIGKSIVHLLSKINQTNSNESLHMILAARDPEKCQTIMEPYIEQGDISVYPYRNADTITYPDTIDWIICAGAVTKKSLFQSNPVEVFKENVAGIEHCLQYAKEHLIKGMLFLSSAVVYGNRAPYDCSEDYVGSADYAHEPYSASKISGELLCNSYYKEYHVPVKIARVYQTYGCDMSFDRGTFLTDLLKAYRERRSYVEIKSDGKNLRNLLHVDDCASALWHILRYGKAGDTYNVGSCNNYSLLEIAQIVAESVPDWEPQIIVKNESSGKFDIQVPNIDKLVALGWKENRLDFRREIKKIMEA